jgi:hypothetical protein
MHQRHWETVLAAIYQPRSPTITELTASVLQLLTTYRDTTIDTQRLHPHLAAHATTWTTADDGQSHRPRRQPRVLYSIIRTPGFRVQILLAACAYECVSSVCGFSRVCRSHFDWLEALSNESYQMLFKQNSQRFSLL